MCVCMQGYSSTNGSYVMECTPQDIKHGHMEKKHVQRSQNFEKAKGEAGDIHMQVETKE